MGVFRIGQFNPDFGPVGSVPDQIRLRRQRRSIGFNHTLTTTVAAGARAHAFGTTIEINTMPDHALSIVHWRVSMDNVDDNDLVLVERIDLTISSQNFNDTFANIGLRGFAHGNGPQKLPRNLRIDFEQIPTLIASDWHEVNGIGAEKLAFFETLRIINNDAVAHSVRVEHTVLFEQVLLT